MIPVYRVIHLDRIPSKLLITLKDVFRQMVNNFRMHIMKFFFLIECVRNN